MTSTKSAEATARRGASESRSAVARAGLVGRGLLYAVFGLLAINIVTGTSGGSSEKGAIEQVAEAPFGKFLLIVLCVGLVALVVWKVLQAVSGDPVEGSEASDRAKFALKAATYAGVTATAIGILIANWNGGSSSSSGSSGSGSGSDSGSGGSKQQATATVLEWPGGRWIVGVVGLGIIAFAAYEFYKHAYDAQFMQRIDTRDLDDKGEQAVEYSGRGGYGAKSIITAIVGGFFVAAGIQHDSSDAKGLSGALKSLAGETWGQALLWFIAVGLFLFAAFSFVEAKTRRAT